MENSHKILIVDPSPALRAMLARCFKGNFRVIEEDDGESAWQALMLDSLVIAVLSGGQVCRFDGEPLVVSLRQSKLPRLNALPYFLVVPDSFSDLDKRSALRDGVSDFIPRERASSVIGRLTRQLEAGVAKLESDRDHGATDGTGDRPKPGGPATANWNARDDEVADGMRNLLGQIREIAGVPDGAPDRRRKIPETILETMLLDREMIKLRLMEILPEIGPGQPVGVLAFGLDGYDELIGEYGAEQGERIARKFSALLVRKLRGDDCVGQLAPARAVILARQTNRTLCRGFAERIRKAVAATRISVDGQRLGVTVSVGIAVAPEDSVAMSGTQLLQLASDRLERAVRDGGNRVVSGDGAEQEAAFDQEVFLARLKELLAGAPPESIRPCLGNVGLQIMPLLDQIDQAFNFGLPIAKMGRCLDQQARSERQT